MYDDPAILHMLFSEPCSSRRGSMEDKGARMGKPPAKGSAEAAGDPPPKTDPADNRISKGSSGNPSAGQLQLRNLSNTQAPVRKTTSKSQLPLGIGAAYRSGVFAQVHVVQTVRAPHCMPASILQPHTVHGRPGHSSTCQPACAQIRLPVCRLLCGRGRRRSRSRSSTAGRGGGRGLRWRAARAREEDVHHPAVDRDRKPGRHQQ
jgi:hypothetical protein